MSVEWKKVVGKPCGTNCGDEKRKQLSVGGNLREGDHLKDQYLDGNVILKIDVNDILRVGVY